MLISSKHNFIFVHIYKCGGTSVSSALVPHADLRFRFTYQWLVSRKFVALVERALGIQDMGQKIFTGYHKHASAAEIRRRLGPEVYDSYYSFSFVRNPYSLVRSLYRYISGTPSHANHVLVRDMSLDEFVQYHIQSKPMTQYSFLSDSDGKLIVRFVGRFENLVGDFSLLCNDLNIPSATLQHLNRSDIINRSDIVQFSKGAKQQIRDYYRADFNVFAYPSTV